MKIKPALAATAITATALLPGAAFIAAGKAHADPLLDSVFVNTVCGDAGICRQPHMMIAAGLKLCYDLQTPTSQKISTTSSPNTKTIKPKADCATRPVNASTTWPSCLPTY